jgi:hypothetical protein
MFLQQTAVHLCDVTIQCDASQGYLVNINLNKSKNKDTHAYGRITILTYSSYIYKWLIMDS